MKYRFNFIVKTDTDDPVEFREKIVRALDSLGASDIASYFTQLEPSPAEVIEARKKLGPKGFVQ